MKTKVSLFLLLCFVGIVAKSQTFQHDYSKKYVSPTDAKVVEKLEDWQDKKFGFIIHWGLYSVPGIVESWSICSEDVDWIPRDSTIAYVDYKRNYFNQSKEFNPTLFDPDEWASMAKEAGMTYLVFTTKHHDGFCMFDTHETDFSIAKGPFKDNPRSDVAKHVFDSFRKEGFMIGAYFSKPDWHSQYYWWDRYATPTRRENYKIKNHPYRWQLFKEYTFNQMQELMTRYGSIDLFWLDGGWTSFYEEGDNVINMDSIARMARSHQPGILVVDRFVHGPHENYLTPEQRIPSEQITVPWETCLSLGRDWGYVGDNVFKTSEEIIHTLIEVVAKGGSLLLGAGPDKMGVFPEQVKAPLKEIGKWMRGNAESIYATRSTPHYQSGNVWFVKSKDAANTYASYCHKAADKMPNYIEWEGNFPAKGAVMHCLQTNTKVSWGLKAGKVRVKVPHALKKNPSAAIVFKY